MESTQLHALTERLLEDVRRRGLGPGDRYLTTEEVSRMLGIRKAVANRAMRELALRDVLVRRQRSGTFIGPGFTQPRVSRVRTVFVLLAKGDPMTPHWSMTLFVQGIMQGFPDVNVQFCFVPQTDGVAYVRELLESARQSGQLAGVVAVSSPPDIYRFLGEFDAPTMAFGSLYSTPSAIHSVDLDNHEAGRVLMRYLIDRGHRRIALLTVGQRRPGDNAHHDGVSEAAAASNLPHTALISRLIPGDEESVAGVIRELLRLPDRPTAIIARGAIYAEWTRATVQAMGLDVPGDVEVVLDDEGQVANRIGLHRYPRVEPAISFVDVASLIGKHLKQLSEGHALRSEHVKIPVVFHPPVAEPGPVSRGRIGPAEADAIQVQPRRPGRSQTPGRHVAENR